MSRRLAAVLAVVGPPAVLVGLGWWLLQRQGFVLVDDAYISFRYAANLAAGHGLVWNPGEAVEGYTNLLWVLLLVPWAAAGVDLVLPAAALGSLAACGCLELLRRVARRLWPTRSVLLSALPGLLLAVHPSFAYWSTAGMEAPLFALCVLLAVCLLAGDQASTRRRLTVGVVLAAACLTRPEGLLVTAALLGADLCLAGEPLARRLRRLPPVAIPVALVVGLHLLFRLAYYGDPLPNTFYAKVIVGTVALRRGLVHLGLFLLAGGLLLLPGLFALRSAVGAARRLLGSGYLLLGVYLLYLVVIGGDHPGWYRFYIPLLPLPLLGLFAVIAGLGSRAARVVAAIGTAALLVLAWPRAEPSTVDELAAAGLVNGWLQHAFFARQVPEDAFVAAGAVGRLGYDNPGWRILDTWGLNDRHIARLRLPARRGGKFGHDKTDWVYVLNRAPDYLLTFSESRQPPEVRGYDLCWPSWLARPLLVYRRSWKLGRAQRSLGMPDGGLRGLGPPPPCDRPR